MDHIFEFCTNIKDACFLKKLSFCRAGINDECIMKWCKTMMDRDAQDGFYGIECLDLSFNEHVTDKCMEELFECIAYKCPMLKRINLSSTAITDKTCEIILNFYQKYFGQLSVGFKLSLHSINIMRCDKVTKLGESILVAIYMEDWCPRDFHLQSLVVRHNVIGVNV